MQVLELDVPQRQKLKEARRDGVRALLRDWLLTVGVLERLQEADHDQSTAAKAFLHRLFASDSDDQARSMLSSLPSAESAVESTILADLLIRDSAESLSREAADAAALIGWLALVAEFCRDSGLTRAHTAFLQGIAVYLTDSNDGGDSPWELASEIYTHLDAPPQLQFISALALAEHAARADDVTQARAYLNRAEQAAARTAPTALECRELFVVAQDAWKSRWAIADALEVGGPGSASDVGGSDWEVWNLLSARALKHAVRGHTLRAIELARAADVVASALGAASSSLETLTSIALVQKEFVLAETMARALHADRATATSHRLLAQALQGRGLSREAEQEVRASLAASPESASAHCILGHILVEQGRLDEALSALGTAIRCDPLDVDAAQFLAWFSPPDIPGARMDPATNQLLIAEELLAAGPERAAVHLTAAIVRANPSEAAEVLAATQRDKGLQFTDEVRQLLFPRSIAPQRIQQQSHLSTAEYLFGQRRFDDAIKEYTAAIEDNPDDGFAFMGVGDCYYNKGQFNLAAAFFEESLAVRRHAPTYLFLADAHIKAGRLDRAREACKSALDVDPQYDLARHRLAMLNREAPYDQ